MAIFSRRKTVRVTRGGAQARQRGPRPGAETRRLRKVQDHPYRLVLCSHGAGCGRTTSAMALAWLWGQFQNDVLLVDADPLGDLSHLCTSELGPFPWDNVMLVAGLDGLARMTFDGDIVVIDGLPLTKGASARLLQDADGAVLCVRATPESLRTAPAAMARILRQAQLSPQLEFLGIILCAVDEWEEEQLQVREQLRRDHGDVLLGPAVPVQDGFRSWNINPPLKSIPAGPAFQAYAEIGRCLYKEHEVPAYLPVVSVEDSPGSTHGPPSPTGEEVEIIDVDPDPQEEPSFSGHMDPVVLLEMLQFLHHTRRSGCLRVATTGEGPAEIELRTGEILAASCGEHAGFEALCQLALSASGYFEVHETEDPVTRNLALPTTTVIMELARFMDEQGPAETGT